jgi:cell division septation protein DedD
VILGRRPRAAAIALLAGALLASACAGGGAARPPAGAARDRTDDPELAAAREAARPEFQTQADALAAGVYEPFVHPDSVRPGVAAAAPAPVAEGLPAGEDPSTDELLGTLDDEGPYNAGIDLEPLPSGGDWTLQLGAFESETGAFVRIRQIASDFPRLPRWYEREGERVRVFVGRFPTREDAEAERARVAAAGYPDVWVTPVP